MPETPKQVTLADLIKLAAEAKVDPSQVTFCFDVNGIDPGAVKVETAHCMPSDWGVPALFMQRFPEPAPAVIRIATIHLGSSFDFGIEDDS